MRLFGLSLVQLLRLQAKPNTNKAAQVAQKTLYLLELSAAACSV